MELCNRLGGTGGYADNEGKIIFFPSDSGNALKQLQTLHFLCTVVISVQGKRRVLTGGVENSTGTGYPTQPCSSTLYSAAVPHALNR